MICCCNWSIAFWYVAVLARENTVTGDIFSPGIPTHQDPAARPCCQDFNLNVVLLSGMSSMYVKSINFYAFFYVRGHIRSIHKLIKRKPMTTHCLIIIYFTQWKKITLLPIPIELSRGCVCVSGRARLQYVDCNHWAGVYCVLLGDSESQRSCCCVRWNQLGMAAWGKQRKPHR